MNEYDQWKLKEGPDQEETHECSVCQEHIPLDMNTCPGKCWHKDNES